MEKQNYLQQSSQTFQALTFSSFSPELFAGNHLLCSIVTKFPPFLLPPSPWKGEEGENWLTLECAQPFFMLFQTLSAVPLHLKLFDSITPFPSLTYCNYQPPFKKKPHHTPILHKHPSSNRKLNLWLTNKQLQIICICPNSCPNITLSLRIIGVAMHFPLGLLPSPSLSRIVSKE